MLLRDGSGVLRVSSLDDFDLILVSLLLLIGSSNDVDSDLVLGTSLPLLEDPPEDVLRSSDELPMSTEDVD